MKKLATLASQIRVNTVLCCCAVALLSACGAGTTAQQVQPAQSAADIIDSADQPVADSVDAEPAVADAGAAEAEPAVADAGAAEASEATSDAGSEPAPNGSPQPAPEADTAEPPADTVPAAPPAGATTSSPAVIYIN